MPLQKAFKFLERALRARYRATASQTQLRAGSGAAAGAAGLTPAQQQAQQYAAYPGGFAPPAGGIPQQQQPAAQQQPQQATTAVQQLAAQQQLLSILQQQQQGGRPQSAGVPYALAGALGAQVGACTRSWGSWGGCSAYRGAGFEWVRQPVFLFFSGGVYDAGWLPISPAAAPSACPPAHLPARAASCVPAYLLPTRLPHPSAPLPLPQGEPPAKRQAIDPQQQAAAAVAAFSQYALQPQAGVQAQQFGLAGAAAANPQISSLLMQIQQQQQRQVGAGRRGCVCVPGSGQGSSTWGGVWWSEVGWGEQG